LIAQWLGGDQVCRGVVSRCSRGIVTRADAGGGRLAPLRALAASEKEPPPFRPPPCQRAGGASRFQITRIKIVPSYAAVLFSAQHANSMNIGTRSEEKPLTQFYPELALWSAVLENAVESLQGRGVRLDNETPEELRVNARIWFYSNSESVGSFVWTCTILGLDVKSVQGDTRTIIQQAKSA
jgi:hypothetical protein